MSATPEAIVIVPTRPEFAAAIEAMHFEMFAGRGYPPQDLTGADKILRQLSIFPDGLFTALEAASGRVVGQTSSMRTAFDPAQPDLHTWAEATAQGWMTTHQPDGAWLYGVDTAVHPAYQGRGVGGRLMRARFDLCRRLNLRGMVGGSVIMGYAEVAQQCAPDAYAAEVVAGTRYDNNLTKQLAVGFRARALIPGYVNDDSSLGWGVLIVWDNPDYEHISHKFGDTPV